jgi:cytochrome P450
LSWAIVYLLENPAVYDKVQEEVDHVVGDGAYPTLEDKGNLPAKKLNFSKILNFKMDSEDDCWTLSDRLAYTQATILEVQRLANLVPVAGRRTMEEVTLNGYTLPAGINVFPLLFAVHEDPRYFPNPLHFNPQRFLDESGTLLNKVEGFIPFSMGKECWRFYRRTSAESF